MIKRQTYYFGFDLENVEEVQAHLINNYKEDVDYIPYQGYGDDVMNAFEVKNQVLNKDKALLALISYCDGKGFFEED